MHCTASFLSYGQTGYFSKIVLDYIDQAEAVQPFYSHPVSLEGIRGSILARKEFSTDRMLIRQVLQDQYAGVITSPLVKENISSLSNDNCFTICTAHQPNIFTGHLYFIYKILHTIKIADWLNATMPECRFVPVYYMGSEDADLEELGHVFINGEKYIWETNQTGAVGRMKVDKALVKLLDDISGQLTVQPNGTEIVDLMKRFYSEGQTIEQATFLLVNELFGEQGLLIVLPDNPVLKRSFIPVIEKELVEAFSHSIVAETIAAFPPAYKAQASGRELNMFYLVNDKRERIEMEDGAWSVLNTSVKFNKEEIMAELNEHPERFSPNVILRPVFQEWILPNIAFVGGGGEIAYWLQLKKVFESAGVPYPLLVLRNSFMFISKESKLLANKLKFEPPELFKPELELFNQLVKRDTQLQVNLEKEKLQISEFYAALGFNAAKIDTSLQGHVAAIHKAALKKLEALEKKMLRAEKRKFATEQGQLHKLKAQLFPHDNLQERIENLMPFYAKWGKDYLKVIYENSPVLQQQFTVIAEK